MKGWWYGSRSWIMLAAAVALLFHQTWLAASADAQVGSTFGAVEAPVADLSLRPASRLPGGIPRVIHQVFLSGRDALRQEEEAPNSKFRRDWRRSCQMHNPGWRYIVWDKAMAEKLLNDKYPWFLEVFQSLPVVVLQGDAIRLFILHTYGGVYLDMDTECMGPLDDSLTGHSLVMQGETATSVNNAQMASAPAHPFWSSMQLHANTSLRALMRAPDKLYDWQKHIEYTAVLEATGPMAQSRLLRTYLGLGNDSTLQGEYEDPWLPLQQLQGLKQGQRAQSAAATVMVYAPKQWFQACEWNRLKCPVELARCTPIILAINSARLLTSPARSSPGTPHSNPGSTDATSANEGQAVQGMLGPGLASNLLATLAGNCTSTHLWHAVKGYPRALPHCACEFGNLVGAHHFSGTWMKAMHKRRDHTQMRVQAAKGLITWMSTAATFVEVVPLAPGIPHTGDTEPTLASSHPANSSEPRRHTRRQQRPPPSPPPPPPPPADVTRPLELDRALWPLMVQQQHQDATQQGCHILSVTQFTHPLSRLPCCLDADAQFQSQSLVDLSQWAETHTCHVTIITDLPASHAHLSALPTKAAHLTLRQQRLTLPDPPAPTPANDTAPTAANGTGVVEAAVETPSPLPHDARRLLPSRGAKVPAASLAAMLAEWQGAQPNGTRLGVLHVSMPGDAVLLAARQLPDNLGELLPRVLLLDLPVLHMYSRSALQPAYQHLYQELGYQGHYHTVIDAPHQEGNSDTAADQAGVRSSTCEDCFMARGCNTTRCVMPSLRIGLLQRLAV